MGRSVNAPLSADVWRVAALTMMRPEQLNAALCGSDAGVWVGAAASCGIPEAQVRLGRLLLEGTVVAADKTAAFDQFFKAAQSGDAEGHNMLGRCYENGWGAPVDLQSAVHHYRLAAYAGLGWAQYNLGHMLLNGNGTRRDPEEAFAWYSRAAARGHERAMNLVARCCEEGWGTPKDPKAARGWYRRSAQGGYFRGAYNYATILAAEGCITGSLMWFRKAIALASEPSRSNILAALSSHTDLRIRALATD